MRAFVAGLRMNEDLRYSAGDDRAAIAVFAPAVSRRGHAVGPRSRKCSRRHHLGGPLPGAQEGRPDDLRPTDLPPGRSKT